MNKKVDKPPKPKLYNEFFTYQKPLFEARTKNKLGATDLLVFEYMGLHCVYNENSFTFNDHHIEAIMKSLKLNNPRSVTNSVTKLKRCGFFYCIGKSTYVISPFYAWKGDKRTLLDLKTKINENYRKSAAIKASIREVPYVKRIEAMNVPDGRSKNNKGNP
jgi:hypothetical protein